MAIIDPLLEPFPHYVRLWFSHGPGCGSTNSAMFQAENSRASAGAALAKVAEALAANLQDAGGHYLATDEEQRDDLAKEMQV